MQTAGTSCEIKDVRTVWVASGGQPLWAAELRLAAVFGAVLVWTDLPTVL